jgi:hypothetical protein
LSFFALIGQNEDVYENWSSIEVDYGLTKNIDIYAGGQLRIKSVGDSYNKSFYELGAKIKINDYLSSGFGYRGIDELDDVGNIQGHEKFNRYHAFLTGAYEYKKIDFRLRLQFQRKNEVGNSSLNNDFFRTRFEVRYDIKGWKADPRIGIEFFTKDDLNFDANYKKYRFSFGTKLNLKGPNSLTIKYILQEEVRVVSAISHHILRLNYNYSIKGK